MKNKILWFWVFFILIIFIRNNSYGVNLNVTQLDISVEANGHEEIYVNQYSNLENLKVVNIREGITKIHDDAFANCPNLTDVTIPKTVKFISEGAFWNSSKNITIHGYSGTRAETYASQYGYKFDNSGAYVSTLQDEAISTYVKNEISNAQKRVPKDENTTSFSFITDLHGDLNETSTLMNVQAFKKISTSSSVDFGICAGDLTTRKL